MGDICNVEIFRAGTWNGEKFGTSDLDAMVAAFGRVGYTPPVKLGHDDRPDAMAYGWVSSLRRVKDRLIANFVNVPEEIIEMIKAKRYDAVSVEIFKDLVRNGVKFAKVLKAIAILGSAIPAVSGLKPLSESLGFGIDTPFSVYCSENVGMKVDRLVKVHMEENRMVDCADSYRLALELICKQNHELAREYAK